MEIKLAVFMPTVIGELEKYSGLENLPGGIAPGFGIEERKRSRIHEQEKSEL
jgi:hypothetical protein